MRQPTNDFKTRPKESIGTEALPNPNMNDQQRSDFNSWAQNTYASQAHKWCVANSGFNLSSAELSQDERVAFSNCLKKYSQSFGLFHREKNIFQNTIDEITKQGGDIYAHLNGEWTYALNR